MIPLMLVDHTCHVSNGRPMVKRQVLMSQPRKIMCSWSWPSIIIFRIDAGSGLEIGSFFPARGQNVRCIPIGADCCALSTIGLFNAKFTTATAPLSRQPSVLPLMVGSRFTSTSSAYPNGMLLARCSGSGRTLPYVDEGCWDHIACSGGDHWKNQRRIWMWYRIWLRLGMNQIEVLLIGLLLCHWIPCMICFSPHFVPFCPVARLQCISQLCWLLCGVCNKLFSTSVL